MEKQKISTEAIVLKAYGRPEKAFEKQKVELNAPNDNEVLIEVEAFGLNYADVMARNNLYKEAPPLPCVLGYEVVGKVIQVGKDVNPNWINQRVVAFTRFGGYAKHACTFEDALCGIGEMDAAAALSLSTQFVTAYYMANYLTPIHAHETVLIHAAAGGVGTALIQLAKAKNAKVIAKIGDESKREKVMELGADVVVNYNARDYAIEIESLLGKKCIDVSFNPVGGSTFKRDFALLNAGGRLILFGGSERSGKKWGILSSLNFVRKMGVFLPIVLMMSSRNILGVNMLRIADLKPAVLAHCMKEVYDLYQKGILKPQTGATFSATKINEAHAWLESGKSNGKIAVLWDI